MKTWLTPDDNLESIGYPQWWLPESLLLATQVILTFPMLSFQLSSLSKIGLQIIQTASRVYYHSFTVVWFISVTINNYSQSFVLGKFRYKKSYDIIYEIKSNFCFSMSSEIRQRSCLILISLVFYPFFCLHKIYLCTPYIKQ